MVRLFPNREERRNWTPLNWVTYVGGVIGIISALTAGAVALIEFVTREPDVETTARPTPEEHLTTVTGRLGARFVQHGEPVPIVDLPEATGRQVSYAYQVTLAPRPFRIRLPASYCGGEVLTAEAGVSVRVVATSQRDRLLRDLEQHREFYAFFPPGFGMAGPVFAQTRLWFGAESDLEGYPGFNHFTDQRFSESNDESVTIAVDEVIDTDSETDMLRAGKPFYILMGVNDAECQGRHPMPIELVRVTF